MNTNPLRAGILVDTFSQPQWIAQIIDDIQKSDVAEIVLVVRNLADPYPPPTSFGDKLGRYLRGFVLRQFLRWDERRSRRGPDPFAPVDVRSALPDVPVLEIQPKMTRFSDYFEDGDVEKIIEQRLDVAIRFGFRILKGRSLSIAKHGVWSYHHGDNLVNRGGPPGFWEVVEEHPATGTILQILTEELDNGHAIYRSWTATEPISIWLNRATAYRRSSHFVLRKLQDLHRRGSKALEDPLGPGFRPYSARLYRMPNNTQALTAWSRVGRRLVSRKLASFGKQNQWFIGYKLKAEGRGIPNVPDSTLYNFRFLEPTLDRFWADPFPLQRDGRYYVFFEEFVAARGKGHVSVVEVDRSGPKGEAEVVFAPDYHVSFPNVFEVGGELYMMPETLERNRIEVFGCVRFPDRWELAHTFLEGVPAADPVMTMIDGLWWLFIAAPEPGGSSADELHVYHSETPFGPWQAHPLNPVKSDVRSARAAGQFFTHEGRIYRPSQNGSPNYGSSITINEIVRLDPEAYEEVGVAHIRPDWAPSVARTHTINAAGLLTVVDAMRRRARR